MKKLDFEYISLNVNKLELQELQQLVRLKKIKGGKINEILGDMSKQKFKNAIY